MNKKLLAYRVVTVLFAIAMLPGAIMDIIQPDFVTEMLGILGIPGALLVLIGFWKLLGIPALFLRDRLPRINEWAYAGFFFDLTGAAVLHGAAGDFPGVGPATFLLIPLMASYFLRPEAKDEAAA